MPSQRSVPVLPPPPTGNLAFPATRWTRRPGKHTKQTLAQNFVQCPFNAVQQQHFHFFVTMALNQSTGNTSLGQLAEMVVKLWGNEQTRRLIACEEPLGGYLSRPVAEDVLREMGNRAFAGMNGPTSFDLRSLAPVCPFASAPQVPLAQFTPFAPVAAAPQVPMAVQKKGKEMKPFSELTESEISSLSQRQMNLHLKSMGIGVPKMKADAEERLLKRKREGI